MDAMASAWRSIPATIRRFRPIRSDSAPVPIWAIPQVAGYAPASRPICAIESPAAAWTIGSSPHAIASFRLLTRPAWLAADSERSEIVLRHAIRSQCGSASDGVVPDAASASRRA